MPTTNATRTVSLSNSTGVGSLNNTLSANQDVSKVGWCERRLLGDAVGRADLQLISGQHHLLSTQNGTEHITWWENGVCYGWGCPPTSPGSPPPPSPPAVPMPLGFCNDLPLSANQSTSTYYCLVDGDNLLCHITCYQGFAYFCRINDEVISQVCSPQPIVATCPELGIRGNLTCPDGLTFVSCLRDGYSSAGCQ